MNSHFDDDEPSGPGWLTALANPFFLFQAVAEAFNSWLFTRRWRKLLLALPVLLIIAVPVGLVVGGARLERDTLLVRYSRLANAELERLADEQTAEIEPALNQTAVSQTAVNQTAVNQTAEHGTADKQAAETNMAQRRDDEESRQPAASEVASLMRTEETTPYVDMLYRRLLRMNDEDPQTRYMVALRLARTGRLSQARQLMQELSPAGGHGYPPAHAWLAIDLLSHPPLSPAARADLLQHLGETVDWDGTGSNLLAIYAELLAADGQRMKALEVMAKAVRKDSDLQSAYVMMARRLKMPKVAEESSAAMKKALLEKLQRGEASEQDCFRLCLLQLTDDEPSAALETARKGLEAQPADSERLKHMASEALRMLYRKSIRQTDSGIDLNLALLDEAIRICPSNPNLSTEIAQLEEMGIVAPAAFKAAMQQQLLSGQATAVAHLVLANQELKAGRIPDAIPHLELALRQTPNQPTALNNLALALALTRSDQLERSEQLIAQAIAINPRNPEYYDTQGEIRLAAKRPLDAIESLEKALAIARDRSQTRQLMVKAYRAAGMEDLASQQEKMLAETDAQAGLTSESRSDGTQ